VAAAAALVALFGLTSIASLPIQLLPNIEEPQISIANFWRAAAPEEMEANIIEPQENVLRNTPGLTNINSFIGRGTGFVNLTFAIGTNIQTAKLDVINNLTQAPPRPTDAMEPQVSAGGGQQGVSARRLRCLDADYCVGNFDSDSKSNPPNTHSEEANKMKRLTILGAAIVLSACASEPLHKVPTNQNVDDYIHTAQLSEVDSIRKGNHDGLQYLNDRYVIYRGNKDYLVEFRSNCRELADNSWIPADYIHDHRNLRAGEDTIRGCIVDKIYRITREHRSELRHLAGSPVQLN